MAGSRRPKLNTKEELIAYLEANPDTELPFNEYVWSKAVENTQGKERKFIHRQTTDFDGNVKTKVTPNGSINPVGCYFRIMALPQYASGDTLDDGNGYRDSGMGDDDLKTLSGYRPEEKKLFRDRLAEYYDNYEINTGTDKFIVRQIVVYELELHKLNLKMTMGKDVYGAIEKVTKQYLSLCESLKALKKQRGAMDDEGKNKFTQFMDTLEKEGNFKPVVSDIEPDEIDRLLNTYISRVVKVINDG